jgi:hypothetical protein
MAEPTSELQEVLERLERVEGRLRRLIWLTLALLAVAGGTVSGAAYLWLTGPRPVVAPSVAAKEFLLVDDAGHVRATLRQHEGHPLLALRGQDDRVLTVGQNGAGLGLKVVEGSGRDRVFVGMQPDFQGLGVWDGSGVERAAVGLSKDVQMILLRDAAGQLKEKP